MENKFSIVKNFKWFALVSIICVAAGVFGILAAPFGLNMFNLDIDFAGGTTMYFAMERQVDSTVIEGIHKIVKESTGVDASAIQPTGDGTEVIIKTVDIDSTQREALTSSLVKTYELDASKAVLNIENVSPAVGRDLQQSAFKAAAIAAILMLIYITIRFDFVSGVAAVVCLLHDVFLMISMYVIFQLPLNINFIAAALIIFGYSINASIITFDRIRENLKYSKREDLGIIVDKSIFQTMTRTINTTLTTLVTIVLIYLLGVPSLQNFALPIIVGILGGAYSSVFLAGSIWATLKNKTKKA